MKSLVCILGMLQPLRGDSTQWYHNCMHGGAHAYLRQKPSTKYATACGFTPFSGILCKLRACSFTVLTTLQLTSVYHRAPLMSVINQIHFCLIQSRMRMILGSTGKKIMIIQALYNQENITCQDLGEKYKL